MNLVIDPNVFLATAAQDKCGEMCVQALEKLYNEKDKHKIFMNQELRSVYRKFIDDNSYKKMSYTVKYSLSYARHLVNTNSPLKKICIEVPDVSSKIQDTLKMENCTPIDSWLMSLADAMCKSRTIHDIGPSVVLLLACCYYADPLALYDATVLQVLRYKMNNLEIECTSNANFTRHHVDPSTLTNVKQHSLMLEHCCNKWLHQHYKVIIKGPCMIGDEEIDVLCYEVKGNVIQKAYVGECKLRVKDESAVLMKSNFASQLKRKLDAVEKYDWKQDGLEGKPQVKGFVFGDHETADDDTWRFLQKFDFNFVQVLMPANWRNKPDWKLTYESFNLVPYPLHQED